MELNGDFTLAAARPVVWRALNDTEILRACIPGCESINATGDNEFAVVLAVRLGPVAARFSGTLCLLDMNPPHSYALRFNGKGGAAGFGKGDAKLELEEMPEGTSLRYAVTAQVGGKLAQVGSRLITAASQKLAADFFAQLNEQLRTLASPLPVPQAEVHASSAPTVSDGGKRDSRSIFRWILTAAILALAAWALSGLAAR